MKVPIGFRAQCITEFAKLFYLEVGLLQDSGELSGCHVVPLCAVEGLQDVRHQLHVVLPHRSQLHYLKTLMGLNTDTNCSHLELKNYFFENQESKSRLKLKKIDIHYDPVQFHNKNSTVVCRSLLT